MSLEQPSTISNMETNEKKSPEEIIDKLKLYETASAELLRGFIEKRPEIAPYIQEDTEGNPCLLIPMGEPINQNENGNNWYASAIYLNANLGFKDPELYGVSLDNLRLGFNKLPSITSQEIFRNIKLSPKLFEKELPYDEATVVPVKGRSVAYDYSGSNAQISDKLSVPIIYGRIPFNMTNIKQFNKGVDLISKTGNGEEISQETLRGLIQRPVVNPKVSEILRVMSLE